MPCLATTQILHTSSGFAVSPCACHEFAAARQHDKELECRDDLDEYTKKFVHEINATHMSIVVAYQHG